MVSGDIDTVTVLKDAGAGATAIYGSGGSNDVILIKTKRFSRSVATGVLSQACRSRLQI